jgi:hypothetical protein
MRRAYSQVHVRRGAKGALIGSTALIGIIETPRLRPDNNVLAILLQLLALLCRGPGWTYPERHREESLRHQSGL